MNRAFHAGLRTGPAGSPRQDRDLGQVGVLIIGYALLALLTVTVVMAASSVYLGQKKLLSAADGAAVAAADTFSLGEAAAGAGPAALLEAGAVRSAARSYLTVTGAPARFSELAVAPETGTVDGRTARVVLTARVDPPIVNFLVPDGISITAVSEARARLLQ
ncbi:pilus assembly protein TadG-related protein [Arthrobacter yangruifuii]|uniref:pilus assembly protein TadG-related protein n=1 Tax=Arthrobacter yangruifuii TaxID=2606616 RepID=UPI0031B89ACB